MKDSHLMKSLALAAFLLGFSGSARAQSVPPVGPTVVVGGTCADGTPGSSSEQCRQHLCATGWAQAHGLGSQCPQSSSTSSAVNSAVGDALSQGAYQIGNAIGRKIASWLFGDLTPEDSPAPSTVDTEQLRELERQRQLEFEHQQQLAAARDAKFRQEMQELSLVMKGPKLPDETFLFKDTSTCFFNVNCQRDRVLEFKEVSTASAQQSFSNPLDQLRISACLQKLAADAKTPDEAKYLGEQAAKARNGRVVDVDVSGCASGPAPPAPTLRAEQTTFYKGLLDSTNQQMDRLLELQQRKVDLEKKKAQLNQQIETQKQAVAQLGQQPPPTPAAQTDSTQQPPTPDAQAQKPSALAEAEAALQQSEQALSDTQKTETQVDNEMKQVGDKIKANQSCFDQAKADPSKIGDLAKSCGQ
jgi:hypothetical protein